MPKRVLVIDGNDQGHFFLSVDKGMMTIGDSPTNAEVVLRDLHISRIHCEVEVTEDLVVVGAPANAAGSLSGKPNTAQQLLVGGALHIGNSHLRLEAASEGLADPLPRIEDDNLPGFADEGSAATADQPAGVRPAEAAAVAVLPKRLLVIDGADVRRTFFLPQSGTVTIGSSQKNADLILHDLLVSRVHCEIEVEGDHVFVTHVEGQDGTKINGIRIDKKQELELGNVLRVGNSHLRLEIAVEEETAEENADAADDVADEGAYEVVGDEESENETATTAGPAAAAPSGKTFHLPHKPVDQLMQLENTVLGHFQIGSLLGRGHAGLVFQAQDLKNNHVVALKVLSPDFPSSSVELQRFVKALQITSHLHHAHLITVHGAGKTGAYCWLAREFIAGESVTRLIQRVNDENKHDWRRACRVAIQIGRALTLLDQHKVAHGNITPRNILVRSSDKLAKLADVLFTKALQESHLWQVIRDKKRLAELPYMAPEQTQPGAFVDRLADLYALGAVSYHLLTGQPPFTGESPKEMVARIREGKLVKPSKLQRGIPGNFEAAIMKLLAKRQEDRYQTAAELLTEIEPIAREHEIKV